MYDSTNALTHGLSSRYGHLPPEAILRGARLRLELIATNALNRPHYLPPNTNISQTGAVGTINGVVNRNNRFDTAIPVAKPPSGPIERRANP